MQKNVAHRSGDGARLSAELDERARGHAAPRVGVGVGVSVGVEGGDVLEERLERGLALYVKQWGTVC